MNPGRDRKLGHGAFGSLHSLAGRRGATPLLVNRERLKALMAEYGPVALWTYFALFVLVLAGFALALSLGFQIESAKGGVGLLGASYLATKLTQPLRIAATLALTPLVARLRRRRVAPAQSKAPGAAGTPSADLPRASGS